MLCPKCGTENTEQADFCTHCAEPLKSVDVQTEQLEVDSGVQQENNAAQRASEKIEAVNETATASSEEESDKSMKDDAVIQSQPRITNLDFQSEKQASEKPAVSAGLNIGIIIGTLIFPVIGIAMGFTYMRKERPDARKAGKTWLILGIIMLLINILVISID